MLAAEVEFDPRSPTISALSLCLLARTSALPVLALAAVLAIGSKFVLRARGKHIFNPTNFAIVVLWLSTDLLWVSPGQWGRGAVLAAFCLLSGAFVIHRATRSDVTWSFLGTYAALILGRALWLGDPLPIVWHSLQNGALLIFAFFMISDPRTTPVHRWSRFAYGALVATVGLWIQTGLHQPNGFLCALIFTAPLVPAIDWLSSMGLARWTIDSDNDPNNNNLKTEEDVMKQTPRTKILTGAANVAIATEGSPGRVRIAALRPSLLLIVALMVSVGLGLASPGQAFCGFYVAKADTKLFNKASQVVLVRDGDRTVITMASDYRGDMNEFAMVIPVPTFLEREQIHVAEQSLVDHLDAYTSPRLVEYYDENPCQVNRRVLMQMSSPPPSARAKSEMELNEADFGVTIEAKYTWVSTTS